MEFKKLITKSLVLLSIVLSLSLSNEVSAQQDPQYSMYMFNPLAVNPAYAGSRDAFSATLLGRKQWVNIPGAPLTGTMSLHTPFKALGLGLSVIHDEIGATKNTGIFADVAYRLNINPSKTTRLAFGLKVGADLYSADFRDLIVVQQGDPNQGVFSETLLNAGFGVYLDNPDFYIGLTAPKLLENELTDVSSSTSKQNRHIFLMGGYAFHANSVVDIIPSATVKMVSDAPISIDANLNFFFYNKLWLGGGYRFGDALIANVVYHFTPKFRAGYAYDYTLSDLGGYTSGSHEIMINYDLDFMGKGFNTPRKF